MLDDAALVSADRLVTVTVGPLPPPVVPPDCVDHPSWLNVDANADGIAARAPPVASARVATTIVGVRQRRRDGPWSVSGMDTGTSAGRRTPEVDHPGAPRPV